MPMESIKKTGVAILVSDKIEFKPTRMERDREGPYIMTTRIDTTRSANNPRYIRTQYRSTQIHKASS